MRWRRVPCDHFLTTMSSDGRRQEAPEDALLNRTLTWHEHVYRKLSGRPTPHYIENILGLQEEKKKTPEHQETVPVSDMNEPLNLSIKSDLKVRSKTVKGGCRHPEASVGDVFNVGELPSAKGMFSQKLFICNNRQIKIFS